MSLRLCCLSLLLPRTFLASFADGVVGSDACAEAYGERQEAWQSVSGATVSMRMAIPAEDPDLWTAKRFQAARDQLFACWQLGGRYWEVTVDSTKYMESIRIEGDLGDFQEEFQARWQLLPEELGGGLCAPLACTAAQVRDEAFPSYLARTLRLIVHLPAPPVDYARVRELSHWSKLDLDFAIGGVNSCGTTSLQRNLAQHPDVAFSVPGEDPFFFRHDHVLPYRSEVEEFNAAWSLQHRTPPRLKGLDHPGLFAQARVRQALQAMPGLRIFVIVCDPLSRLEKVFWRFHMCGADSRPVRINGELRCWDSASALLEEPELMRRWRMAEGVASLHSLLGPRLLLLHQEQLRAAPHETFNRLVAFLGAGPFPAGSTFQRHNSDRGHRTDLCRNASLFRLLKAKLEPEYAGLRELLLRAGVAPPAVLTRCERKEELRPAVSALPGPPVEPGWAEELRLLRLQVLEGEDRLRVELSSLRLAVQRLSGRLSAPNRSADWG